MNYYLNLFVVVITVAFIGTHPEFDHGTHTTLPELQHVQQHVQQHVHQRPPNQPIQSISLLFWNLRTFGIHRASREHGEELAKIGSPFDILLFAEVKDSVCSGIHCPLHTYFESYFPDHKVYITNPLHYCDHHHPGSEEYAILLKNMTFEPVEYIDTECLFIRPPHGVKVRFGEEDYFILVFHSHPGNKKELIALQKVFEQFGNKNILLMGDLNTGCHYVSFEELKKYGIGVDYGWKLDPNMNTNFERTCPYDRMVSTKDIYPRLHNERVMNKNEEAERIRSDHYPIAVELVV
jgi:hypothetical protein